MKPIGKRPLRVIHVTQNLNVGGQEKLLVEFARHHDRRAMDMRVLSLSTRGPLTAEIEACGVPVHALGITPGLWPGLIPRLGRLFRQWRCDVIHTHNNRPLIYGGPAARLAGLRHVIHTQHGRGFAVTPRQWLATRWAAALASPFVCVSEDSACWAVEQGIAASRIQVLWNGIDLDKFAHTGPRLDGPAVIVARLNPEKDIASLLRATALIVRTDPGFRLEIAGAGPCLADLQRLAAELCLGAHLKFLGLVHDVPALLGQASMYVLSSLSEGVSLTLLEAMARGLPVVATRVGGTPEVVEDGVTGVLAPAGDPEALAQAILQIRRNPERAAGIGQAGRARVEKDFDVRGMVARYESLYRQGGRHAGLGRRALV